MRTLQHFGPVHATDRDLGWLYLRKESSSLWREGLPFGAGLHTEIPMSRTTTRNIPVPSLGPPPVFYPDSDGQPMAENTEQFDWIVLIKLGLEWLFADQQDVFVAGDLLWYPVEGDNKTRIAPDVLVVFGRPKGTPRLLFAMAGGGDSAPRRL